MSTHHVATQRLPQGDHLGERRGDHDGTRTTTPRRRVSARAAYSTPPIANDDRVAPLPDRADAAVDERLGDGREEQRAANQQTCHQRWSEWTTTQYTANTNVAIHTTWAPRGA